jgi:archaellum component FlaC
MSRWTRRVCGVVLCLLAVALAWRVPIAGQETAAGKDVLPALLAEVRALRLAMEQMAAAGPRVQLVMGRLQLQEQRLNDARRKLDEAHDSIANLERESGEARDRMSLMEETAQRTAEPTERDALSAQVKQFKAILAQKAADIQRLRDQEAELTGVVAMEESRWTEISQRLDELERSLAPRR